MDTYSYSIQPNILTVSLDKQMMELFITNDSTDVLVLDNVNNVDIADYPGWGEPCAEGDPAGWEFMFSYGEMAGDLNTAEVCDNITLSMYSGGKSWQIMKKDYYNEERNIHKPYWQVIPRGKVSLNSKESLIFLLENISVNNSRGSTLLTIKYKYSKHEPIKVADLSVTKMAKPVIKSFKADKDKCEVGDEVEFTWDIQDYYPAEAQILLDNLPVSGTSHVQEAVTSERHTLQVQNYAKYSDQAHALIAFEVESSINITAWKQGYVEVTWNTKSMDDCKINTEPVGKSGSQFYPVKGDTVFTLTTINKISKENVKKEVGFQMPVIEEFTISLQDGSNQLQKEGNFLSREEVYDEDVSAVTIVPYAAPDPPTPPDPPVPSHKKAVLFSYKTKNADKCSLDNSDYSDKAPSATNVKTYVDENDTSATLRATGNYGYQVTKEHLL